MTTKTIFTKSAAGIVFMLGMFLLPVAASASQFSVSMQDDYFSPQNVTVNAGDTVTWNNQGSMAHTVTADNGAFNSGTIQPGGTFSVTFNTPGTYAYHCQFHGAAGGSGMSGTITVVASGSSASSGTNISGTGQAGTIGTVVNIGSANGGSTSVGGNSNSSTSVGGSGSTSAVATQAQLLLAQVQALEQQIANGGGSVSGTGVASASAAAACPQIGQSLSLGSSGNDVTRLQQYLALDPTVYPQGLVTGYYGALTQAAVQSWQIKFNIVSSGTPATTGFGVVGPRTAAAIAIVCSGGSYNGVSGSSSSSNSSTATQNNNGIVSGFMQISPISGNAPLTVSVIATINTANSCSGATYTLSFGDNTGPQAIVLPSGSCSQEAQTITHTYQYAGTYQIALASGAHATTANVTVYGQTPSTTTTTTTTTPTTTPLVSPNLPAETLIASTQSGAAPLSVTFSGVVNSNDAGFCNGTACSDTLDFGDGTSGTITLPSSVGSWLNYSLVHTYTSPGGFNAVLYQGKEVSGQPTVGNVTITVAGGSSVAYTAPTVTPNVGNNPLAVSIQFNLQSSCDPYQVTWGSGIAPTSFTPAGSTTNCSLAARTQTLSHTYTTGGTYTITLQRGTNLSQTDTVAITIAN